MGREAKLWGTFTAMVTPMIADESFRSGARIDFEGFESNLEMQLKAGITPVVLGTTGEAPQISEDEMAYLVSAAVRKAEPYLRPVVVGVSSEDYGKMIHNAQMAKQLGANYVLATPTPYVKLQQHEIIAMYEGLNDIGIPIIVYNIEGRTGAGTNIKTATLSEIAQLEQVVGVKEASGNLDQMQEVIDQIVSERPYFSVLSGDDNKTFPLLEKGGDGVISVVSNLVPEMVFGMVASYLKEDVERARDMDNQLKVLYTAAFLGGNPQSIKEMMRQEGLPSGPTRKPLQEVLPQTRQKLAEALEAYKMRS